MRGRSLAAKLLRMLSLDSDEVAIRLIVSPPPLIAFGWCASLVHFDDAPLHWQTTAPEVADPAALSADFLSNVRTA